MNSLTIELLEVPTIQQVTITDESLSVDLSDGRTISVPLAWYPRLLQGSTEERSSYRFIGGGSGIHWNELDEDVSLKNLIFGQPSGESQKSFQRWLESRIQ
ncbi:MAG: Protein of unknown function (DUF2442) [Phormidesmis priestleyi Ana]|uniref:DUF2442 domain-containing protein n=1 Tax=Phormidesmis priestleyi Ana TaxID=1666911 RepID=A0A0P7YXW3_9CYAN|nr:MAG: Protein of unknown function (DUF2442) [Phormidesmis priestleyi Ana]